MGIFLKVAAKLTFFLISGEPAEFEQLRSGIRCSLTPALMTHFRGKSH